MRIKNLVGLSGIVEKFKGALERAKMRIEEARGPKYNKKKLGVNAKKISRRFSRTWLPFSVMGRPRVAWGRSYTVWVSLRAKHGR